MTPDPAPVVQPAAGGCVEQAVRASCGDPAVAKLYRLRDRWAACEADLSIERIRREDDAAAATRALEVERALGEERVAGCRRELAECHAIDRPPSVPWWVWPVVGLGGAAAGAAAWEAIR